jgi:L-lactate dehydrogenase complex protein LldE
MVDQLYPEVGMAAVELLERQGVEVVFPDAQTCCGQPAFNAGYRGEAREMARHFLDVFWPLLDQGAVDAIVAPSGSCVAMVKNHYPIMFENSMDDRYLRQSIDVANATYELTQYLVDELGVEDTDSSFASKLTYHPCCHLLRELHVDSQPRRLLANVRDAHLIDLPDADECCGFGGLFAIKNAAISTEIGRRKVKNIQASGADLVVVNDVSCLTHLNGILEREGKSQRARHIAEVLRETRSE